MKNNTFFTILFLVFTITSVLAQEQINVFVFSKTAGFRHKSIEFGQEKMKQWAKDANWKISFSEDTNDLNSTNLSKTDVVVFLNTTGTVFDEASKVAFKKYINNGGGFVGIHAATDTEYE